MQNLLLLLNNFLISVEIIHNHLQYPSNNKGNHKPLLVELIFLLLRIHNNHHTLLPIIYTPIQDLHYYHMINYIYNLVYKLIFFETIRLSVVSILRILVHQQLTQTHYQYILYFLNQYMLDTPHLLLL